MKPRPHIHTHTHTHTHTQASQNNYEYLMFLLYLHCSGFYEVSCFFYISLLDAETFLSYFMY